jgi:hypothetical protein
MIKRHNNFNWYLVNWAGAGLPSFPRFRSLLI